MLRTDLEKSWAEDEAIQPFTTSQIQIRSSVPSCSRQGTTQFELQLPSHLQPDDDDLGELSHEDGIQLIDEMYGAEQPDYSTEDMDTNDDEMYYVPVETHYELEKAHKIINETNKTMQSSEKPVSVDASACQLEQYEVSPIEVNDAKDVGIKADILEARELLHRAQQELDKLRSTRQEIESDFLWCLETYITPKQISIQSRF